MRPVKTLTPSLTLASILIAAACVTVAAPAVAQQRVSNPADGRGPGMRYLSWPGKAERPRVAPTPAPQPMSAAPDAMNEPRSAPSEAPITSFAAPPPATTTRATRYSARSGPTPASAWIGNGGAPAPVPLPAYEPPAYQPPVEPAYIAPPMAPTPPEPAYEAPPVYAPPPRSMPQRRVETTPAYAPAPVMMPEPPRGYPPVSPVPPPRYASPYDAPRDETPGDRGGFGPPRYEVPLEAPPAYAESSRDDRGTAYPMPETRMPEPMPVPVPTRPVAADTGPAVTETIVEQPMPEAPPPTPQPPVAPTASAEASPPAEPAFDPMAPRRDALIFRMLGRNTSPAPMDDRQIAPEPTPEPVPEATPPAPVEAAPEPASQAQAQPAPPPPGSVDRSPRRYSVHRANGQAPDRTPLPDPVFLDSAPIDLAEPPEAPTVMRNVNGRIQAITPSEDPVLP